MNARRLLLTLAALLALWSCRDDSDGEDTLARQTVFVYMPWASDLTSEFLTNLSDLEAAIGQMGGLGRRRVVVYFAGSGSTAYMFEITCRQGVCSRDTFKTYTDFDCTTEAGLTAIIRDMKTAAPALAYSMTIGGHGTGWLPAGTSDSGVRSAARYHWSGEDRPKTRFFGGTTAGTQTDIFTLAQSIRNNGIVMEYVMFDDCYMSSLEVAYELREAANYLIGCPTEIMAYGMPYGRLGKYLLSDSPDYEAICRTFLDFYSTYKYPYGTIAVTDCRKLNELAGMMRSANALFSFDESLLPDVQRMDGYTPALFYDYGGYVKALCGSDEAFLASFNVLLDRVVPHKAHTESYYSAKTGIMPIADFSGITISEPSKNPLAAAQKSTAWYIATH